MPKLPPASPVVFQQATGKLALAPVASSLPERGGIGSQSRNVGCWVFVRQLTVGDFPPSTALTEPTSAALAAARLTVTADPSGDVSGAQGNDYLLTATVAGVNADMCNNTFMEDGPNDVDLQVDVDWKLWSVRENRVVFETGTNGIGHSASHDQSLLPAAAEAMRDAVARLLQTATMQQYLTFGHLALPEPLSMYRQQNPPAGAAPGTVSAGAGAPGTPSSGSSADSILMIPIALSTREDQSLAERVAAASVSITAGQNSASGVLLSSAGYIMTANSLIGDADTISVTLSTGQQVSADIVRRDAADNVALLKIAPGSFSVLPVEPRRPKTGAQVYAANTLQKLSKATVLTPGGNGAPSQLSLTGSGIGVPVANAEGSLIGLIIGHSGQHTSMLPIGLAFHALRLGAVFEED